MKRLRVLLLKLFSLSVCILTCRDLAFGDCEVEHIAVSGQLNLDSLSSVDGDSMSFALDLPTTSGGRATKVMKLVFTSDGKRLIFVDIKVSSNDDTDGSRGTEIGRIGSIRLASPGNLGQDKGLVATVWPILADGQYSEFPLIFSFEGVTKGTDASNLKMETLGKTKVECRVPYKIHSIKTAPTDERDEMNPIFTDVANSFR